MDKAKTKVLLSILKESPLYETMSHEERVSLIARLEEDYPSIFEDRESGEDWCNGLEA